MNTFRILLLIYLVGAMLCMVSAQEGAVGENEKEPAGKVQKPEVSGFSGMAMLTTVRLKWDAYSGASLFNIYRSEDGAVYSSPMRTPGAITSWTDSGLEKGKKYFYKVTAVFDDGTESAHSPELDVETLSEPPFLAYVGDMPILRITTLYGLCITCHPAGKDTVSERAYKGVSLAREFIWRNSRCRMNISMVPLAIEAEMPSQTSGGEWEKALEKTLESHRLKRSDFDFIFATGETGGDEVSSIILSGANAQYMTTTRGSVPYPGIDPATDYDTTWLFTRSFYDSFLLMGGATGTPAERQKALEGGYREIAGGLSLFNGYDNLRTPWNKYIECTDMDSDGIPDIDDRVPLDERGFLCSPLYKDTDNDYLDDLDEATASIWFGTSSINRDTDGDGILDGKDAFSLIDFRPEIKKVMFVPTVDGRIEDTWSILSTGAFWSNTENPDVTVYANRDDGNLYFASKTDKRRTLVIEIAGSADDPVKAIYIVASHDEELEISFDGKTIVTDKAEMKSAMSDDGTYHMEMRIPFEILSSVNLTEKSEFAVSVHFYGPDEGESVWITDFHGFYEVFLAK